MGLSDDGIALLPRFPNKRGAKDNLFNFRYAHMMACDVFLSPWLNNKFVDFHALRFLLHLLYYNRCLLASKLQVA